MDLEWKRLAPILVHSIDIDIVLLSLKYLARTLRSFS